MRFDKARVAVVLLVSLVVLVAGLGGAAAEGGGGATLEATPTPLAPAALADPAETAPQAPDCTGLPDLVPYDPDTFEYPIVPNSVKNLDTLSSILYAGKPTYFDWWFANVGACPVSDDFHVEVRIDDIWFIRYPFNYIGAPTMGTYHNGFADWAHTVQSAGEHTISIVVDPDNVINELDESNNTWSGSFHWEPVNSWWAEFYNNRNLQGDSVLVRDDPFINFAWEDDSPGPGVNADNFSVRWTRDINFNSGVYLFFLSRDDGMRFFIDGQKLLDEWNRGVENIFIVRNMTSGSHALRLEAMDIDGFATARLFWYQCYSLTTTADPATGGTITVSPPPNCGDDLYADGTFVTLTAEPAGNYFFSGWGGDLSGAINPQTLEMDSNKSMTANFSLPCYTLTRSSSTGGGNPTANPPNSTGCAADHYTAGQAITLTATPNSGHRVKSWSGTANDASTATTNTVTMPDRAHTVGVTYEAVTFRFFVPLATHQPWNCFPGPGEREPNNTQTQANGPLCASGTYSGLPNDQLDYFAFDTTSAGPISVEVADHRGGGVQLLLYYGTTGGNPIDEDTSQHNGLRVGTPNGPAGRYYVIIYAVRFYPNETNGYTLRVSFPEG